MSEETSDPFVGFDREHDVGGAALGDRAVDNGAVDNGAVDNGAVDNGAMASEPQGIDAPPVFIPLDYLSVDMVLPSTNPTLILRERASPHRELHIAIGVPEGVAIAYAARHVVTPRPLTHELFTDVLEAYNLTLETVRITRVERSAYEAELVLSGANGMRVLSCRVSDGVCLALRQRLAVPVTAAAEVLDQAAFDSTVP